MPYAAALRKPFLPAGHPAASQLTASPVVIRLAEMARPPLNAQLDLRPIESSDWPYIEALFGANGACGGCWCMHWRIPKGGKSWEAVKGEPNRLAFKSLVESGNAHGIIALAGQEPVGWCAFGKRTEFPRTETVKALQIDDTGQHELWSINCFFVRRDYRNQGVSERLAKAAVEAIRKLTQRSRRATVIEAYPFARRADGSPQAAAFVWSGTEPVFKRLGFRLHQRLSPARPLYRLKVE